MLCETQKKKHDSACSNIVEDCLGTEKKLDFGEEPELTGLSNLQKRLVSEINQHTGKRKENPHGIPSKHTQQTFFSRYGWPVSSCVFAFCALCSTLLSIGDCHWSCRVFQAVDIVEQA